MKAKLLLLCLIAAVSIAAHYPGEAVKVQISMENVQNVNGIQLTLCDIPDYLTLNHVEATTRTLGFSVEANEVSGCVRVLIFSTAGNVIPAGIGGIVTLHFDIVAEALSGDVVLQLSEYIVADVDNEPLPVIPIDGALIIVPIPTPSPTPTPTPTPVEPVILEVNVL